MGLKSSSLAVSFMCQLHFFHLLVFVSPFPVLTHLPKPGRSLAVPLGAAAAAAAPPSPVCGSPCQDRQAQRGAGIEAAEREQGLHCESHIQLSPAPAFSPGTETSSWFWPFELLFWGAWFPPVVMQEPRVSSLPGKLHPQLSMELPTCSQDRSRLDPPSHTEGVHWVPSLQAQQPLRLGPRAFSRLQKPECHTPGSSGSPK